MLSQVTRLHVQKKDKRSFKIFQVNAWFKKPIDDQRSFKVIDISGRLVAFIDESELQGKMTAWKWASGNGLSPTERYPCPLAGTAGKSRRSKFGM